MNRSEKGLYDSSVLTDDEAGTERGRRDAATLVSQARDLALLCSHALASALEDDDDRDVVQEAASRLMYVVSRDLTVAVNIAEL